MPPKRVRLSRFFARLIPGTAPALLLAACAGEHPQTTFRPVTEFGSDINDLFANTTWWGMGILVIVEIALLVTIFRWRHDPQRRPSQTHGNTLVEIVWTVIPAVIVAFIVIPTVGMIWKTQPEEPEGALVVEAVGHQWWWEFRIPEYGVVTANQFHLPVGRPIRMRLRSADVIHSFWIPRIGGKRDVNPVPAAREGEGMKVTYLTFTIDEAGVYDGQCAEYCGTSHAIMRMRVIAQAPAEFEAWAAQTREDAPPTPPTRPMIEGAPVQVQPPTRPAPERTEPEEVEQARALRERADSVPAQVADTTADRGRQIFTSRACIACHTIKGTPARGVVGPNLTNYGDRWSIGAGAADNTQENLERWIRSPRSMKAAALMPGTQDPAAGMPPTGLSDEDVRAVAAYLLGLKAGR